MANIPWAKIKAEWLKGGITQKELAEKYKVNLKTLQNRASNEGWRKAKGKIREKTEEQLTTRIAHARANKLAKLIDAQDFTLDALVELAEMVKENPKLLFTDKGELRNAESLTRAIQTATMTQRDLHSIKNIDQKFAAKKWKEEQKLQRELKLERETGGEDRVQVIYVHEPVDEPEEAEEQKEGAGNE